MKTFYFIRNTIITYKHFVPVFLLVLMSCNQHDEKIAPPTILKAKPIHKIQEKTDPVITPPDSTHINKDTLQMSKDTSGTMDQAPKRPTTMPKKYFKLNIHKRAMITLKTPISDYYKKEQYS